MGNTGKGIGTGVGAGAGAIIGGPAGALIGAGIGGGIGGLFDDSGEEARAWMQKALAEYESLGLPPDLSGPIIYQQLQAGGLLTPAMESALNEEVFNASSIQDNQETRADLTAGLNQIRSKAFGSGYNPEQMAMMQKAQQQANANTQSQLRGILQGQAARGQSGAGDSLAAMLNANQQGAQQLSNNALQIGAQGMNAQDAALRDYLTGMGALRSSDQSREQYNAGAQQAANMYKAQNASARQARNVASMNQGNQLNWNRQNSTNDYNTQMANQEKLRQQEAKRAYWNDRLALAQAKGGAYSGMAGQAQQQANNQNQNYNNIFQGLTSMGGSLSQNPNNLSWGKSTKSTPNTTGSNEYGNYDPKNPFGTNWNWNSEE